MCCLSNLRWRDTLRDTNFWPQIGQDSVGTRPGWSKVMEYNRRDPSWQAVRSRRILPVLFLGRFLGGLEA